MSDKIFWAVIVVIVIALGFFLFSSNHNSPTSGNQTGSLTSLNTGSAPWAVESDHLQERMQSIGLQLLSEEGTAQHIHAHLDVYIHGKQVSVPGEIGIVATGISPVHTHDTSGIIHIESADANATYTLGQFFTLWGVKFTDDSIGGYTADTTNKLTVYDNGIAVTNPTRLTLGRHDEIVVVYGSATEVVEVPKSFTFPDGL